MLNGVPSRRALEIHYLDIGVRIERNVGGGGRYSVEVDGGVLGICDTLLEAETLCEDARDQGARRTRAARTTQTGELT